MDDVIIASNDSDHTVALKVYLNTWFYIKEDILQEAGLLSTKPVLFSMEQNHRLALDDSTLFDNPSAYRHLVGRLIYLTITKPEFCYSIHIFSQFMNQPIMAIGWQHLGSCATLNLPMVKVFSFPLYQTFSFMPIVIRTGLVVLSFVIRSLAT